MTDNIIAPDMQKFIDTNKQELIKQIFEKYPNAPVDDDALEGFIYNEEWLYHWARREGVDI